MPDVLIHHEVGHRRTGVLELDVVELTPKQVGDVNVNRVAK
jgi:hypothetical protein